MAFIIIFVLLILAVAFAMVGTSGQIIEEDIGCVTKCFFWCFSQALFLFVAYCLFSVLFSLIFKVDLGIFGF